MPILEDMPHGSDRGMPSAAGVLAAVLGPPWSCMPGLWGRGGMNPLRQPRRLG